MSHPYQPFTDWVLHVQVKIAAENWQVALLLNAAARAPRRLGMANPQETMLVPIYFDGFRIVPIQKILELWGVHSDGSPGDCISEKHQLLCSLR